MEAGMQRFGQVIGIKPEHIEQYSQLHAAVWPEVLQKITECNIRNYSIYAHGDLLFAYFEYHGTDFDADMARMAADPKTQAWWAINKPLQSPLPTRSADEWWATMQEIFHTD
jgi:L-rhamnose mutarotase